MNMYNNCIYVYKMNDNRMEYEYKKYHICSYN